MAETVLLYNCEGEGWKKLRALMMMVKLRVRMVKPEQYGLPLQLVAAGKGDPADAPYTGEGFDEPVMVFCNVHPGRIQPILNVVRLTDKPSNILKAVMTPTNKEWNSEQLWQELCRERQAMQEALTKPKEATEEQPDGEPSGDVPEEVQPAEQTPPESVQEAPQAPEQE